MAENPNGPNGRVFSEPGKKSRTKQADALNSDVNTIVARHVAHRIPLPPGGVNYSYGDFSDFQSFHDSANRVKAAEQSFSMLPASVRKHCHNDPGEYLDIVFNPERRAELEKLGMQAVQAPQEAPEAVKPEDPTGGTGPAT